MKRLSVDISDEQHLQLKIKAAKQGITIRDLCLAGITNYLRDNPE